MGRLHQRAKDAEGEGARARDESGAGAYRASQAAKEIKVPTDIAVAGREANVLYVVPPSQLRALGKAFGRANMAYKEVGLRSFNYAYDRLVGSTRR